MNEWTLVRTMDDVRKYADRIRLDYTHLEVTRGRNRDRGYAFLEATCMFEDEGVETLHLKVASFKAGLLVAWSKMIPDGVDVHGYGEYMAGGC